MSKLLLVDGHNLLFKAFYGIPEKLLPNGRPIQGITGFIGILTKIIKLIEPTHILVVFDPDEKPSRADLFAPYKQNRQDFSGKADRENPFSQLDDIKRGLDSLQVKYIEQPGYEADDMIASYALQTPSEVIIASSDTDFLQLICHRITVFCYRSKKSILYTETEVQERYGILPSKFLEYKALIGDKTDNIDGVRGVGPKNAVKVLNGEKGLTEAELALFERNLGLIKLNTEIELPYTLDQLSFSNRLDGFEVGQYLRNI